MGCRQDNGKRLDAAMKEIGLYQKLEKEMPPRRITPNSSRHYCATYLKVNEGWSWEDIAMHLGHDQEQTQKRYAKVTSAMITAKKKAKTGLAAIDNYAFRDLKGEDMHEDAQEVLRSLFVRSALQNPDHMTYEIINGEPTMVLLLSDEDYADAKRGFEDQGDLYQLRDGTKIMLRCRR